MISLSTCSGSPVVWIATLLPVNVAIDSNDLTVCCSRCADGIDQRRRMNPSRSFNRVRCRIAMRSARGSGGSRHSVASTTLNIVVVAAMPSASVAMAARARPRERPSDRSA